MDFIKYLFDYLTDTTRHFSTKASLFLIILLFAILGNNIFGFTYYYNINNKIEKISSINQLLKDSTMSVSDKQELTKVREDIIYRITFLEAIKDKISVTYDKIKNYRFSNNKSKEKNDIIVRAQIIESRSNFWFITTSSGLFILMLIIIIPAGIIVVFSTENNLNAFLGVLVFLLLHIQPLPFYIMRSILYQE